MSKNLYQYADLIKLQTPYAKRMQYLSNRIFGEVGKFKHCHLKIGHLIKKDYFF